MCNTRLAYLKNRGTRVVHRIARVVLIHICLVALVACVGAPRHNSSPVATLLPRSILTVTAKVELSRTPRLASTVVALLSVVSSPTVGTQIATPIAFPPTITPIIVTPQTTDLPTASPTVAVGTAILPTNPLTPVSAPRVYETTITIPTYGYEQGLEPSSQDDPIFPYPHLNFDKVGPPVSKDYRAIILENDYTQLTIVPELGGRILRWIDKTSGKNLFYANPVIKPTQWGYRGWWLATGGMEWAFPVEEHGLNEYRPWTADVNSLGDVTTIRLSDTEDRTGLVVQVNIALDARHSYYTITPCIHNPTATGQKYQFWLNGMFNLGNPAVSGNTQFIFPTQQVTIHSTGDSSMPDAGQQTNWPDIAGRDMSWYKNWREWLGVSASPGAQAGFEGAYDRDANLGVVRIYPPALARGAKIFAAPGLDPGLWTDDNSRYYELWGGLLPTFADYANIAPGASVCWTEHWYAVNDIDGYDFATEDGAVRLTREGENVSVAVATTTPVDGTVILLLDDQPFIQWPARVSPGAPFVQAISGVPAQANKIGVQLINDSNGIVIQHGLSGR
jgi:hypothetical protein